MSSVIGQSITFSLFGESHGALIGMTIDRLPAGMTIDQAAIVDALDKRRTGGKLTSQRKERDAVEWLTGLLDGKTTGAPLTFVIYNTDQRPKDYDQLKCVVRPSHADYSAYVKFSGFNDKRGGGMFSGRLTACFVVAGCLVRQLLGASGIKVSSSITRLGKLTVPFDSYVDRQKRWLDGLSSPWRGMVIDYLSDVQAAGDSVGGTIRTVVTGLAAGVGEPHFYSLESVISSYLFAIPGAKAVEFGDGVTFASKRGSDVADNPHYNDGELTHLSNHNGGILGGISNGMPLDIRCTFKPTSSIYIEQSTVDLASQTNTQLALVGRHDPAFVVRVPIVVESVVAMALYDSLAMSRR